MPDEDDDKAPRLGKPIKMTMWQRGLLGVSGAGMVVAGGWAEIASGHDGAGTVAFVAAGALFAGLGIVGRIPNRISGKDYTAEFEAEVEDRVEEKLGDAVEVLPRTVREELATARSDMPLDMKKAEAYFSQSPIADIAAQSVRFEDGVLKRIEELAPAHGLAIAFTLRAQKTHWDALLEREGRKTGVIIYGKTQSVDHAANLVKSLLRANAMEGEEMRVGSALLISPKLMLFAYSGNKDYLTFDGPDSATLNKVLGIVADKPLIW